MRGAKNPSGGSVVMNRMVTAVGPMILLNYGVSRGLDADELCATAGWAPHQLTDPRRMISFDCSLRLWRVVIAQLPDENVGVGVGRFARLEHFGFFFEFAKHVACGLDLLRNVERYWTYLDTVCETQPVTIRHVDDRVEIRWPTGLKHGIPERVEALNVATLNFMRGISGESMCPAQVRAAHPVDPKRVAAEEVYGCEVLYDAPDDALCFEMSTLLKPFGSAAPEAAKALMELAERRLVPDARLPFPERVRRVIEVQIGRGDTSQAAVATSLGIGVRSLQRALHAEGVRYADVLGEVLERVATELMRDRARSLEAIAAELGYSAPSSFSRAWKRITGESAAQYRARLLQSERMSRARAAS